MYAHLQAVCHDCSQEQVPLPWVIGSSNYSTTAAVETKKVLYHIQIIPICLKWILFRCSYANSAHAYGSGVGGFHANVPVDSSNLKQSF